jgi:hypothetical protein
MPAHLVLLLKLFCRTVHGLQLKLASFSKSLLKVVLLKVSILSLAALLLDKGMI